MSDDEDAAQPPLELHHISFTRGKVEGKPCVVVYDAAEDKTTVISVKSRYYAEAMAALEILTASSVPLPKPGKKTILHAKTPKLILPGSLASN